MQILLIEDDPAEARLIQEAIGTSAAQIELTLEGTLARGIASITANSPLAVLLDLGLPDSEGMATVKAVREAHPQLPIVVLTGLDDTEAAMQAVSLGAQYYLVKGKASTQAIADALTSAIERTQIQVDLDKQRTDAQLGAQLGQAILVRNNRGGIEELMDQVTARAKDQHRTIIVTVNRPANVVTDELAKRFPKALESGDVSVLDCTGHPPNNPPAGVYSLGSPTMLEVIGLRVEQLLRKMGPATGVIIDDLNTLVMYNNIAAVTEPSHYVANRLRAMGVTCQFMLTQGPDHELIASRVTSFLDD